LQLEVCGFKPNLRAASKVSDWCTAFWAKDLSVFVNSIVYGDSLAQVQLRLPQKMLEEIDQWVAEGRFKSRSDAIKSIIAFYEEREKTCEFLNMLLKHSKEAKKHPESLVRLGE
jgi:Arc/MetJ-type ribon-helix-helix transcriptional regulator